MASFCCRVFCSRSVSIFFDAFFDLRDPQRDLLLFLLEFFQRHDLVAQLREVGRLRRSFAAEIDLALLQKSPLS